MDKAEAEQIAAEFTDLSGVGCEVRFLKRGKTHKASALKENQEGVYVFLNDWYCLKVGKVGSKSQARWGSQHYLLDEGTRSSLPKSFMKDEEKFKKAFNNTQDIRTICKETIREFVENNTDRVEFVLSDQKDHRAVNLLEAYVQFKLNPVYEGKTPPQGLQPK